MGVFTLNIANKKCMFCDGTYYITDEKYDDVPFYKCNLCGSKIMNGITVSMSEKELNDGSVFSNYLKEFGKRVK